MGGAAAKVEVDGDDTDHDTEGDQDHGRHQISAEHRDHQTRRGDNINEHLRNR